MNTYDAELVVHSAGPVYYGHIYNDTKGRFVDGTFVRTSLAVSVEGDILQTRNTRYKLIFDGAKSLVEGPDV
jgi:hypothetical protein